MKHTPGDWTLSKTNELVIMSGSGYIGEAFIGEAADLEEAKANAVLMKAGSKMLKALKVTENYLRADGLADTLLHREVKEAIAAAEVQA